MTSDAGFSPEFSTEQDSAPAGILGLDHPHGSLTNFW